MLEIDNARVVLQNSLSKKENSKPMFIKIIATKYFSTDASIDDCTLAKTIFRYFKYNFDDIFLILNQHDFAGRYLIFKIIKALKTIEIIQIIKAI